jgi:hypothetical protein
MTSIIMNQSLAVANELFRCRSQLISFGFASTPIKKPQATAGG